MSYTILLVDDDKEFRSVFKKYLEGYRIIETDSGAAALAILKKPNDIDLVILDVVMPGLQGIDVLREIRKVNEKLSVIMLTAYGSKDVAVEALRSHADDFIEKGMSISEIERVITRVMEAHGISAGIHGNGLAAKIEKAKRYAEINCYKKFSLRDAAESVCLSPKYLSRVFKEYAGTGFSAYRLAIKIKEARRLLAHATCNVSQIADKLGYKNVESFIRQFKKMTGTTPSVFRKSKIKKTKRS
ncbi:MAG: response regulator [Candidatus Omnitrophota bacterium]|nr:response regulator [Candidatus Omnitrophota bacterium]